MNRLTQHILTASLAVFLLASGLVAPAMSLSMDGISTSANFAYATEHDVERYQFLAPIGGLGDSTADGGRDIDVSSEDSLPNFAKSLITLTIGFAIMAAIVLLVIAGFRYMTTVKDGAKSDAKKSIGRAIGGLVLALAAVVILQTINPQLIELRGIEHVTVEGEDITDPNLTEKGWCIYQNMDNIVQQNPDTRTCFIDLDKCLEKEGEFSNAFRNCFYYTGRDDNYIGNYLGNESKQDGACLYVDSVNTNVLASSYYQCTPSINDCLSARDHWRDDTGNRSFAPQTCGIYENGDLVDYVGSCYAQSESVYDGVEEFPFIEGLFKSIEEEVEYANVICKENISQCESEVESKKDGTQFKLTECEKFPKNYEEDGGESEKNWNSAAWCSTDKPSVGKDPAGEESCWNNKASCEGSLGEGNCYQTPNRMAKKDNSNYQTSCENCVFLNEDNYKVRSSGICTPLGDGDQFCRIKEGLDSKLTNLNGSLSEDFPYVITEAFPPTVKHSSNCHYNGSCVDLALRRSEAEQADGRSKYRNSDEATQEHADKIIEFIEKAEALGLSVTYEVGTYKLRDGLWQLFYRNDKGSIADRLKTVGEDDENENGNLEPSEYGVLPHFSVYQSNGDR